MNIIGTLKDLGYTSIDGAWYDRVETWDEWYRGNVDDFHSYTVWNGSAQLECQRYSLGMAEKVCMDWANLLMNEKVKITLDGEKEQTFIDEVFKENDFEVNMNELQEKGAARGTYAIVPRIVNATINAGGFVEGGKVIMDYITAEHIFPLSWRGRAITECAFASEVKVESEKYLYLQLHVLENGLYEIQNHLFLSSNGGLDEVAMTNVKGFERVPHVVRTKSDKPQFVIGRYNIANNIEENNPMGISVYANAIDTLKAIDIAYDSYVNEFVLGKKRVMVKPSATKTLDGNRVFDPNDVCFYVLPEDVGDGTLIQPIDMALRVAEHEQGVQGQLNLLSAKCGFGQEHYKFEHGTVATATQIVSENSDMFRSIKKHEIVLDSVLKELCRILLRMGNNYGMGSFDEDTEVNVDFDDSIIEDKTVERANDRQDLAAGIMNPWEYRAKWYNESEEEAKKNLPPMTQMITEGQTEIE